MACHARGVPAGNCVTPASMTLFTDRCTLPESRHSRSRQDWGGGLGQNLRPDGVTLLPWARGKPMIWDYTWPDTFAASHLSVTQAMSGGAAEQAERNKGLKYAPLTPQYELVPIAIETMGAYGTSAWAFVSLLGARVTRATGDRRATSFLRQRISVAVQRGNAVSVRGTRRESAPPACL